jgi:predicted N-acetyltransferase YhbS
MRIHYLAADDSLIKTLATWIYREWLQNNPEASVARMCSILSQRVESTQIPLTLVSFSDQGHPIGVVSLTKVDMQSRADLSPWLSGLYVLPEYRRTGVGAEMCKRIADESRRLGFKTIYLYTKDRQPLYSKLGWKPIFTEQYNGDQVTVMALDLEGREGQ